MITIKTKAEIDILKKGGHELARILDLVIKKAKPGVPTSELDEYAEKLIIKIGGRPAFKNHQGFPGTMCISPNDVVVHGVPKKEIILKDGDIVGFDVGMQYPAKNGLYTDMARTIGIGKITPAIKKIIKVTERSFHKGIGVIKPGARIGDIGEAVQKYVESSGYSVVRSLSGHGVGYAVHEDPQIPNFGKSGRGDTMEEGMVFAIEPMVCGGGYELQTGVDGWTAKTQDGSITSHYENTIVVTKNGCDILTK